MGSTAVRRLANSLAKNSPTIIVGDRLAVQALDVVPANVTC